MQKLVLYHSFSFYLKSKLIKVGTKPQEVSLRKREADKIELPKIGHKLRYKVKIKEMLFKKMGGNYLILLS